MQMEEHGNPVQDELTREMQFVQEPMRNKTVHELPWIGEDLGPNLAQIGYSLARQVLGMFLISNEEEFKRWLCKHDPSYSPWRLQIFYGCMEQWLENSRLKRKGDASWRGIDNTVKESLGCSTALQVVGYYLVLEDAFPTELSGLGVINEQQIEECYDYLKQWCKRYL